MLWLVVQLVVIHGSDLARRRTVVVTADEVSGAEFEDTGECCGTAGTADTVNADDDWWNEQTGKQAVRQGTGMAWL